jgi:hypothetical protein
MLRFHRVTRITLFALSLSLAAAIRPCAADVRLPRIFGNQMVLQRELPVRMWGTADPAEKVTVSIGKNESSATADEHVAQRDRILAADVHLNRISRFEGGQLDFPAAVLVGLRGGLILADGNGDFLARIGLSPNADRQVALQDHLISENLGKPDVGRAGLRRGDGCQADGKAKHQGNTMETQHGESS